MGASANERRLAAILSADVVGYSRMMAADEAGTLARLRATRRDVVDPLLAGFKGRIFKVMGDGLLAEFPSAVQALRCAIAIQQRMRAGDGLQVRIGLHQGDVVVEGSDLLGDGVNVAARLEAFAEPGGICISARVREDAAGKMSLDVKDMGTPPLKNIAQPVHVFRVLLDAPERPGLALPDRPSLVVLPFQNMSGDVEQEYFVDGLVEDITTALAHIPSLFVIARNSAFTYKGRAVDVRQVGRELGVRYVLEGSVRKAGNRLRITGQLVDAATGAHLWADRFDGALDDVFDLQDRITTKVAGVVEPRLQRAEIERAQRKSTNDLGAYDYFLRGMAVLHQAQGERFADAQALFAEAYTRDTNYGAAYGMAALCVNFRKVAGLLASSAPEIVEGVRLARVAAATGREDATALWCAGYVLAYLEHDLDGGIRLIERACTLNPNSAMAWNRAGYVRAYLGEYPTALENFERAIRLSPADPLLHLSQVGMSMACILIGDFVGGLAWSERAASEQPNYSVSFRHVASTLALLGRLDEARSALEKYLSLAPEARVSKLHADARALMRRPEDWTQYLEGLRLAGMPE